MNTQITTFSIKPHNEERGREIGAKYDKVLHGQPGHLSTVSEMAEMLSGAPSTSMTETVVHDVS